jgi:hypothetical protein
LRASAATRARPAATAPDDTSTTSRPAAREAATKSASVRALRSLNWPESSASRLLPTLSTARFHGGNGRSGKREV